MTDRVKSFIEKIVKQAVEAVVVTQELRDCRFGIFNEKIPGGGFRWICLDIVCGQDQQETLWAHTNDFDPMVYGWSACEFSLTTRDRDEAIEKITAFLTDKARDCQRIEAKLTGTASQGQIMPTLVGDSDIGELAEPAAFPGF